MTIPNDEETDSPSNNFQTKKNSSKLIIVGVAIVALIAIGIAAFALVNSNDSKSDSADKDKNSTSSSTSTTQKKSDAKSNEVQLAEDIKAGNGIEANVTFDKDLNAYIIAWVIPRPDGEQPDTINDQSNAGKQAQLDAVSTLRAVQGSAVDFENVRLDISAIRANEQGADETVNMVKATYSAELIDETDFKAIDEANIFAIGKDIDANPDFNYYLYLDLTV